MSKKPITHVILYSDQDPPDYAEGGQHKTVWHNKKKGEAYVNVIGWRRLSPQQLEQIEKERACHLLT